MTVTLPASPIPECAGSAVGLEIDPRHQPVTEEEWENVVAVHNRPLIVAHLCERGDIIQQGRQRVS